MRTAIKHPVPDRVKPAVICNFWHPGTLTLSPERQSARMSKITDDGLTRSGTGCFIAVPMATVGVNGLSTSTVCPLLWEICITFIPWRRLVREVPRQIPSQWYWYSCCWTSSAKLTSSLRWCEFYPLDKTSKTFSWTSVAYRSYIESTQHTRDIDVHTVWCSFNISVLWLTWEHCIAVSRWRSGRALDFWPSGHGFASRSGRYQGT